MKFNSQICTTREQSERLIALGLKKETADCRHLYDNRDDYAFFHHWVCSPYKWHKDSLVDNENILAWSLHRLIEMMPMSLIEDRVYHERWDLNITPIMVLYRNQDQPDEWIGKCLGQGMYNNVIDCIEWLIMEGYFPKEYLEE